MIFMTASAKNRTIEMIKNVMINIIALFAVIFEITSIEIPKTADGIKNIVRAFKMKEKIADLKLLIAAYRSGEIAEKDN